MALYYPAVLRLIPPGESDPVIEPIGAILHVDAGNAESLYGWFSSGSGGVESHFFVRRDGVVEQYRDTSYEADANSQANSFTSGGRLVGFVSIETQGYEHGEWTPEQIASIKDLLLWLSRTHKFPLRPCPGPFAYGVGYHVMFGAPGPWTSNVKTCPGPDRIRQFNNILVPWMKNPEEDMPLSDSDVEKIVTALLRRDVAVGDNRALTVAAALRRAAQAPDVLDALGLLPGVFAALDRLPAKVVAALPPTAAALTVDDVEAAAKRAIRDVLGSLNDEGGA